MSKYGFIKIASYCPEVCVASPSKNARTIYSALLDAAIDDIQIAVFPELCLSGYTCADLFSQDALTDGCINALLWLLEKTKAMDIAFVVGLPLKNGNRLYNCAALCQKGKVTGFVPKSYIPNNASSYEKRWFSSGKNCKKSTVVFDNKSVPFGKILFEVDKNAILGIEIGEDLFAPVAPSDIMSLNGANIIVNTAAFSETVTANDFRKELIKAKSAVNCCAYVLSCAGVFESTTDSVFSGSCVIAENGNILSESDRFARENTGIHACIDVQKINHIRSNSSVFSDGCDEYYSEEYQTLSVSTKDLNKKAIDRTFDPHPFIPKDKIEAKKRCEEIFSIQSSALAKRLYHTKIKKLVIGISGGLDSTLALLVAAKAADLLGIKKSNIICITMPGFGTTEKTKNNSVELVKAIGAELRIIDIKDACIQHFKDIDHDPKKLDVTYENVQARERTQILMDIANKEGALLVGTGDLSELALGWCTYNGDHMSMYSVNCDIPKTLVRHLVDYVRSISMSKAAIVLQDILDTPVSPELLPPDKNGNIAQKTEDNIGPYELHDFFLYHFLHSGATPEKIYFMASKAFNKVYDRDTIYKWLEVFIKRFFISQFKRSCVPDGPKVGSVGLSPRGDWKMPSDASYEQWLSYIV